MSRPSPPEQPDAPRPSPDAERRAEIAEVESEIEELGDPEAGPALPSTTLAAPTRVVDPAAPPAATGTGITREVLRLAWPVMLSGAMVSLVGLVDRAMIGRLGGPDGAALPLAAVGYATQIFFLIQSTIFAIGFACVALVARAIGAGEPERARAALGASLQVGVAVTAVLSGAMLVGAKPLLAALGAGPEVIEATLPYYRLVLGASIALSISMTLESGLRANKDTRTPMWIALAVTVVKLVGNALLIFGTAGFPRLGLLGAGIATAVSQVVGLALFALVFLRLRESAPLALGWRHLTAGGPLRREVVRISLPGVVERLIMNLGMLSYFWVLSQYYGTLAVATYTVGVALLSFSWIPGTGYAQACATLVGQALGQGRSDRASGIGWRASGLAVATAVLLGVVCALTHESLARLFTSDEAVVTALGPFLLVLAAAQPFLQFHFTLGGAHRGAGDTWTPLLAASVGNWLFRVPLAWAFAAVFQWDVVWVWIALVFDHIARSLWLAVSFRRGSWQRAAARAG